MAVHIQKRQDYISWDEYFMGVAMLSGMRSKDPNSQVERALSVRTIRSFHGVQRILRCSDDEFPMGEKASHWIPNICM